MSTFFKSPDAVIGPGDTIVLPTFRAAMFRHEAELAIVIGGPAKNVQVAEALSYVFGYTTAVDVSCLPVEGEAALSGSHHCHSFDTFLPIGPFITTADEFLDPNNLRVQSWVNGVPRQNYNANDMEHSIAYMVATLSHNMTLKPGDLILAGTDHTGIGPLQNGDMVEIEIEKIGLCAQRVEDPLPREWVLLYCRPATKQQPQGGSEDDAQP